MTHLVGIYSLLAYTPIWLTAIVLWTFTDGVIHLMRDRLEGLGYQTSFSAKFGDAGLIAATLIAATILQRDGSHVPDFVNNAMGQVAAGFIGTILGAYVTITTTGKRSGQAADIYHDLVIGPAIFFLVITLLPVIWENATTYEWFAVCFAAATWTILGIVDIVYDRMNQRQWLIRHGFPIKGEVLK